MDPCACECDGGVEAGSYLAVAGGESAELLEAVEPRCGNLESSTHSEDHKPEIAILCTELLHQLLEDRDLSRIGSLWNGLGLSPTQAAR